MKLQRKQPVLFACCSIFAVTCFSYAQQVQDRDIAPTGQGIGTQLKPGKAGDHFGAERAAKTQPGSGSNGIYYHGGPLLGTTSNTTPNVYYIWYGNWYGNTANTLLENLAGHLGQSSYFNINSTYSNGSRARVLNAVNFKGSTLDNYSNGASLGDSDIEAIVSNAIESGALPNDSNGVYFVLTSADVNETSGFCKNYCGWHTHGTLSGTDIKYAFVGNPDRCPSACEEQTTSPNGNAGADGMASVIAHELEESVTDPDLNAWYDRRGEENADKCAWTFGTESTAANGSKYNVTLGGLQYLIQQNWVNASGGYCAMSY